MVQHEQTTTPKISFTPTFLCLIGGQLRFFFHMQIKFICLLLATLLYHLRTQLLHLQHLLISPLSPTLLWGRSSSDSRQLFVMINVCTNFEVPILSCCKIKRVFQNSKTNPTTAPLILAHVAVIVKYCRHRRAGPCRSHNHWPKKGLENDWKVLPVTSCAADSVLESYHAAVYDTEWKSAIGICLQCLRICNSLVQITWNR